MIFSKLPMCFLNFIAVPSSKKVEQDPTYTLTLVIIAHQIAYGASMKTNFGKNWVLHGDKAVIM